MDRGCAKNILGTMGPSFHYWVNHWIHYFCLSCQIWQLLVDKCSIEMLPWMWMKMT